MRLRGKVCLVTGGSRGLGAAIVRAFAREGAIAVPTYCTGRADAEKLAADAGCAEPLALDVRDRTSVRGAMATVAARYGRIDVLVNNAGVMWVGRFEDEPEDAALRQFDVNFHGVARGLRLAVPRMRARGGGHVVTVASAASRLAPAGEATYAASKHAVYGYCTALQQELRGSGVELSVVMPIVVETELARGTTEGKGRRLTPEEVAEAVVATIRAPRFEVWVPRQVGFLTGALGVMPQRLRARLHRALVPDQVRDGDGVARRAYEVERFTEPER